MFATRGLTGALSTKAFLPVKKIHGDDNARLIECRDPMESDLRRWFRYLSFFFLARNTPLHEMTKMLSVKTAERRHVPAATSIQIYSISHRSLLPPLRSSLFPMYNSHYISFSRRWKKGGKKNKIIGNDKSNSFCSGRSKK